MNIIRVKQFGSRLDPPYVSPNCLQRFSAAADNTSKQRVGHFIYMHAQLSSWDKGIPFGLSLHLCPAFASCVGYGKTAHLCRLN